MNLQCMNNSRNVTQYREQNVNEEVRIASTFEEHTQRWEDDSESSKQSY